MVKTCIGWVFALALCGTGYPACAVDGMALNLGTADSNSGRESIDAGRLARLSFIWDGLTDEVDGKSGWYIRRLWEFDIGYWEWDDPKPHREGDLAEVALRPTFRLQRGPERAGRPYLEGAIGIHFLSETVVSDRELSTNFHFGSHLGVGFYFGPKNRYDLTLRLQHLSNAGIENPNPGINFYILRLGYYFGN